MTALEIPLDTSGREYCYTLSASLSGLRCDMRLTWNTRAGRWAITIDCEGVRIVSMHPVTLDVDFLSRVADGLPRPHGRLVCVGMRTGADTPGLEDLGTAARLYYAAD